MPHSEQQLRVLRLVQEQPDITQRQMAEALGISLGGLNYCLQALVQKGWVKIENFNRNPNKFTYAYLLTPSGLKAKTRLTAHFLQRKLVEYDALKAEIKILQAEMKPAPRSGRGRGSK